MRRMCVAIAGSLASLVAVAVGYAGAEILTEDRAVQIALEKSTAAIQAEAGVLDARGARQGAYSGILPHLSADFTRFGSKANSVTGTQAFGSTVGASGGTNIQSYANVPELRGSWSVLDLSAITGWRSAGAGLDAAQLQRSSNRNDIALSVRRQYYLVVGSIWIARVNSEAVRLARDDERRVRSLFEVGSVPRSDLLKAQVRTAQAELDSLTSYQQVIVFRINLANSIGIREQEMGEIDTVLTTVLTAEPREYDRAALLSEATMARPDIKAAEAEARAAGLDVRSAKFLRVPYVTLGGSAQFQSKRNSSQLDPSVTSSSETDRQLAGSVALNWNIFDGLATDARISAARARKMRADDARDFLHRQLESEVDQAMLAYHEALERNRVAQRATESAEENVKLIQQKYNVGSSTILDLVDAQVQLQRARSDRVTALTLIRAAEAQVDRVRGRGAQ